ncbi:HK97 gp10 family phage protein [Acinetobacter sp. ANC 7200]|uniref:HK97-gp10 family putative phage morphogenesis protein n=1 Tax=Acinetobacter amyesii TaxID=2942470 RepID=UPI0020BECAB7|nr:HK97-gp10 family putative phage morphogenesis protein [Acinetobacter amyesii]MCL6245216.1 HK97 gp10 family phage protein [Acinetobacter amyesii]
MSLDVQIHGIDELNRKLTKLANTKIAKRIARKAARQAMNIVRDAARANAKVIDDPETAEKIWKNIAVSGGKSRNANEIVMRVGVRGGASFSNPNPPNLSGGDTRHWRFKEFPTARSMGVPFMRPAMGNNIQKVTDKFSQVFSAELDKELEK